MKALEDSALFIQRSTVNGNVEGDKADTVQVDTSVLHGNITISGGGPSPIFNFEVAICSNHLTQGNIQVEKVTIGRALLIGAPGINVGFFDPTDCRGNTLDKGNIIVQENAVSAGLEGFQIRSNTLGSDEGGGNLQVFKNSGLGSKLVSGNTVTKGTIQCAENSGPFIGSPNSGKADPSPPNQCTGTP